MTRAHDIAVQVAAQLYDPRELSRRNEAEGFAARRLAAEYNADLTWIWAEAKGSLVPDEYARADDARAQLNELHQRIGQQSFSHMVRVWRDEFLIEGVDY